ncbi:hypothetical protein PBY51_003054 [Eleginops maclovinus]|uniref:Uncharacterized protein n=1 Tax=Eleginops maclovinus TaxID=56733 RepID=A0AAN7XBC8_ELEMC|nr:hypothetical protein PBY51_003054 [Eleginops maclovinus]
MRADNMANVPTNMWEPSVTLLLQMEQQPNPQTPPTLTQQSLGAGAPHMTRQTWPFLSSSTRESCCRAFSLASLTFIFICFIFCTQGGHCREEETHTAD